MISNHPGWPEDIKPRMRYPQLKKKLAVDVVIIGGGLCGILTAYFLNKAGKKVALVEKKKIGDGATEYTTAFVTGVVDTDLNNLKDMFGEKKARLVWESGNQAIDIIENIVNEEKIECDFKRCPAFMYATSEEDAKYLKEIVSTARKLGFKLSFSRNKNPHFNNFGLVEIKNQAKFHPLKFLSSLAQKISNNGISIFEETEVLKIVEDNPVVVKTKQTSIEAQYAILATYEPLGRPLELLLKNGLYISYVLEAKIPKNRILEAIYWDIESPYHYFRVDSQKNHDRLIIGGEDHRSELKIDPQKNYLALEKYLKTIMPGLKYELTRKWAGPIMETIDGLPYIGRMLRNDSHLVATGFSGNGMTYSAIAAIIFRDIIMGNKNEWLSLYNAKRIPTITQLVKKGVDYTKVLYGGAIKNFLKID